MRETLQHRIERLIELLLAREHVLAINIQNEANVGNFNKAAILQERLVITTEMLSELKSALK